MASSPRNDPRAEARVAAGAFGGRDAASTAAGTRPGRPGSRAARAGLLAPALVAPLLGGWIAISLFHPFTPDVPQGGLDASWVAAMAWAADKGLRWGVDLAFTYGPASTLVTGAFNAAYLSVTLPLLFATCVLFAAAAALLARRGGGLVLVGGAVALGAAAALSSGFPDGFFLALPLAPFLLVLSRARPGRAEGAVAAAAAVAVGAIGMAKMSYPLSALPLFLLGDAAALLRRRAPVLTVACLLGLLAADVVYGQSLADLPAFVRMQGEVVAGYSEAMALDGSRIELLAFPLASALLVGMVAAGERRAPGREGSRVAVPLGLAWVLLLLFKAGFVRQDAHTLIAWHGLTLAAILLAVSRLRSDRPRRAAAVAAVALAAAPQLALVPASPHGLAEWAEAALRVDRRMLVDGPADQLAAAADLLWDPSGFAAARRAELGEGWRALASSAPLPRLDGGVDVIPSQQSRVIAGEADYRPRPSFQEYSTYTPALVAANRAFLQGPRAPAWVLFGPEPGLGTLSLDRRYPNLAEGALWLDLVELYRPERRLGELVALRRRDAPAPLRLGEPRRLEVGFDETVPVEAVGGGDGPRAVFAAVDLPPTLLGRVAAFLYKPPPLTMDVRFADGHEQLFQFVSGIAASGFVLSPEVENASEFEALSDGSPPPPGRVVTGFSLHAPPRLRVLLPSRIGVVLRAVSGGAVASRPAPASGWASLVEAQGIEPAASSVAALPPSGFHVPVSGLSRADFGYGLALAADAPPGAEKICFAIQLADGRGRTLWRRCLDRAAAGDRAPQSVSLAVPPGTAELALLTTCEAGCEEGVEGYWAPPP